MKRLIYTSLIMTFLFILVAGGAWAEKGGKPGKPPGGNGEESEYKVTDLGTLDGGKKNSSAARDISDRDTRDQVQVVGWSDDGQQTLATLWTVSPGGDLVGMPSSLETLDGQTSSEAYAINQNATMVAGHADTIESPVPVYWKLPAGSIKALDPLGGFSCGVSYDVNNNGQIAGISKDCEGGLSDYYATVWDENYNPTQLPSLANGAKSRAFGINNDGDVVGMSWVWVEVGGEKHYLFHAVLWWNTDGGYQVCDLHVWEYADSHRSHAYAITDRDSDGSVEITGERHLFSAGTPQATVWTVAKDTCPKNDDATRDLGLLAYARDINDAGEVVGQDHSTAFVRPVVWVDNQMIVLPLPKKGSGSAEGINADGQIVGWSQAGGRKHAVLWTKKD